MSPLGRMNLAPLASALSGTQRMSVGGGARIPKFGPAVAASPTKAPSAPRPAAAGAMNMLSRPTRNRQSGIAKTAKAPAAPKAGRAPKLGPAGPSSAGPGVGGF